MRLNALFGGILGSLLSTPVLACMCSSDDPPAAFNHAAAVFIGTLVSGTEQVFAPNPDGTQQPLEAGQLKLVVDEVFKGRVDAETLFEFPSDRDSSCISHGLVRGERYLFYAYAPKAQRKLIIGAGACNRTTPMDSDAAREDLRFLRNLPPAGSGGTLRATVRENRRWSGHRPFAGITLQIEGPDRQLITATTDSAGRLEVKGLKPGK